MTTFRSPFLAVGALALIAASLAACGGGGQSTAPAVSAPSGAATSGQPVSRNTPAPAADSAAAGQAPDPCSLLTDAEASTALGGPATHKAGGSRDASNGNGVVVTENRCQWDLITSDQSGHDIWIGVYAGGNRAYYDDAANDHSTAIPGLGDAATGDSVHVWVFSKGTTLQIYGSLAAADGLQQIAAVAIAKL